MNLEEQARQTLMIQALYRILEQQGGSVTLPLRKVVECEDMGGISIAVRPDGSCELTAMTPDTCSAFQEALDNPRTDKELT